MITITKHNSNYSRMTEDELVLDKHEVNECYLFTKALPNTFWPAEIQTPKGTFKFEGNWMIPNQAVGYYTGYARFVAI